MKNSMMIPMVVAGGCGLVAMFGVQEHLANKGAVEEVPMAQVLVAKAEIDFGEPLDEMNTQLISVPMETCPPDVVNDLEQIEGKTLSVSRSPGDMIRVPQLAEGVGTTVRIPDTMKVVTISVDAKKSHSGMLRPGNRIDLLVVFEVKQKDSVDKVSRVLPFLQYVEVFAVEDQVFGSQRDGAEGAKAQNISLLVTNEQAMKLALADSKGEIVTMLRSNSDTSEIETAGISEEGLFRGREETINETSSSMFDSLADASFDDGLETPETGEMFASSAVPSENVWEMTIFERGVGRRVKLNSESEEPLVRNQPQPPMGSGLGDGMESEVPATGPENEEMLESFGPLRGLLN